MIKNLTIAALFFSLCFVVAGCGAKKEKAELIELMKSVEISKPTAENIMKRFSGLQKYNSPDQAEKMALEMANLVVEIDKLVEPIKDMKVTSNEVARLREEYLVMWKNLQDGMRMVLEVMMTRDPKLGATLEKRVLEKDAEFKASTQVFESDYIILKRRYKITAEDLGIPSKSEPRNAPGPVPGGG